MALQWTIGHEFEHATDRLTENSSHPADQHLQRLRDSIWDMISEKGRKQFFEGFLFRVAKTKYEDATPRQLSVLKKEMLAEFMGARFADRKWLEQLAQQKPALFGDFVRDWIRMLSNMIDTLKSTIGLDADSVKRVDKYIADLNDAKAIAMDVAEAWAKRNPKLAKQSTGSAQFSSRIDEINELGNFNLDANEYDDSLDMTEFLNAEDMRSLQQEINPQAPAKPKAPAPVRTDVSAAEIAANSIMAEDAYPDLSWDDRWGEGNLVRLILANLRNVRELMPEIDDLVYTSATGRFSLKNGSDAETFVRQALEQTDARAFGLGRSTLARAAMTRQTLDGIKVPVESFAEPVMYSDRATADTEYEAVRSQYEGSSGWMTAPDGAPSKLTERQWVQVRTPSFKAWFGDWEKAHAEGGVWASTTVSKAVGSNGEPLVVYHGTDKGGFMSFTKPGGRDRGDLGIFTTSNGSMADSYVRKGRASDITPVSEKDILDAVGVTISSYMGRTSSRDAEDSLLYRYETPDGDEVSGFSTEDAAIKEAVSEYGGEDYDSQSGVYGLFMNIRNPYESDFEGATWSGERSEQWILDMGDGEPYWDPLTGKTYFSEEEARAIAKEFAAPDDEYEGADFMKAADDHYETTDSAVREGRTAGHDGTIITNVVDDGGGRSSYDFEPSDVFVANKPNQVKSADWNTGEFGGVDDLRFSEKDRQYKLDIEREERTHGKQATINLNERNAIEAEAAEYGLSKAATQALISQAREIKKRYPKSEGWMPLEVIGVSVAKDEFDNVKPGSEAPKFRAVSYGFNTPTGKTRAPAKIDEQWLEQVVSQFESLIKSIYKRAEANDKNALVIVGHQTWYRNMAELLRRQYGGFGDTLADLLGATSPNTPVDTNWRFSVEILSRFVRGDFSTELNSFVRHLDGGGRPSNFPGQEKIRQISGKLYGMNSGNAMIALANMWRNIEAGSAPKARNFALNLIGQSDMATIDVWAARMLRRAADSVKGASLLRIPPPAEQGVTGVWNADVTRVTGEFGFGAEVMRRVSERMIEQGYAIQPQDLQAIAWFAEKELWGSKGWTTVTGEGGSFEERVDGSPATRYIAGWSIQQGEKAPSNDDVSIAQARVMSMLVGDSSVIAARVMPTFGLYSGVIEHSFDTEWTVAKGQHDPSMVMAEIARLSKENSQYDIFVSKVVDPTEENPNARPGVEIYFKTKQDLEAAMPVLKEFTDRGQDGFTLVTDVRSKPGSEEFIGVRLQYVPEISMRWDEGLRKELLAPGGIERALRDKEDVLNNIVQEVRKMDGVAYANMQIYDTVVVGKENYDEYIDRVSSPAGGSTGGTPWFGRPIRQGLEGAVARYEGNAGQVSSGGVPVAGGEVRFSGRDESTRDGGGRDSRGRLAPLEGSPSVPGFHGPDSRIVSVAEQYARENGIDLKRQAEYVKIDPERATRLAQAYADMAHAPGDLVVKEAFQNLIKQTTAQYQALADAGYRFHFIDLDTQEGQDSASNPGRFNAGHARQLADE